MDGENEKTPYAEVGKTYKIPSAYAFDDICGGVEVSRSVYYNYNSENTLLIAEENGRFKTDYAGSYAIVYSAKDFSGNASEKIIWVSCLKDAPDPQITLVKEECKDSATVGEKVVLAGYTVGSGSGALSVMTAY